MPAIAPLFNFGQPTANLPSGNGTSSGGSSSFHSFFGQAVAHYQTPNSSPSGNANRAPTENDPVAESIPTKLKLNSAADRSLNIADVIENAIIGDHQLIAQEFETDWDDISAIDNSWLIGSIAAHGTPTMPGDMEGSGLQGNPQPVKDTLGVSNPSDNPVSSLVSALDFTANGVVEGNITIAQADQVKTASIVSSHNDTAAVKTEDTLLFNHPGRSAILAGQKTALSDALPSLETQPSANGTFSEAASNISGRATSYVPIDVNSDLTTPVSSSDTAATPGTETNPLKKPSIPDAFGTILQPTEDDYTFRDATSVAVTARNGLTRPAANETVTLPAATDAEADTSTMRPAELASGRVSASLPLQPVNPGLHEAGEANTNRSQGTIAIQGASIQAEFVKGNPLPPAATTQNPVVNGSLDHLGHLADNSRITATPMTDSASRLQSTGSDSGPLMVSLQQLTSLKPQENGADHRHSDRANDPLREQFKEHMQQVRTEANQGDNAPQSQTGRQDQNGPQLVASPAQTAVSSHFGETITMTVPGQLPIGQGTITQANVQPQAPVFPQPLHDNLIFQQVADHFQLQMRNQQTRLHIQLQPAELGKMEIQLTVKEGGVRAQVMVQSGQVQEILERNLNKLRTILEGQGFTVEDLIVEQQSETPADMDLFQQQLARHQAEEQHQTEQSNAFFSDSLENAVNTLEPPISGVNIRA